MSEEKPESKESLFPKELPKSEPKPEPKTNKEELQFLRNEIESLKSTLTEIKKVIVPEPVTPPTAEIKKEEKDWVPWDIEL